MSCVITLETKTFGILVLIHISLLIKPGNVYQNKLISNESKQYCWSFNSPFD
uniref:Uncharacterized protein n=1 Tax=Anguilla anguilla TaxID=7936 RepID=A0A0E9UWK2_ANGAN